MICLRPVIVRSQFWNQKLILHSSFSYLVLFVATTHHHTYTIIIPRNNFTATYPSNRRAKQSAVRNSTVLRTYCLHCLLTKQCCLSAAIVGQHWTTYVFREMAVSWLWYLSSNRASLKHPPLKRRLLQPQHINILPVVNYYALRRQHSFAHDY